MKILVGRDLRSAWDDLRIYRGLLDFTVAYRENPKLFQSFAVIFERPEILSEDAFEENLWARLQSLSDKDAWHGQDYDERVSPDPENPHFSLSFGGEAFFVVVLHPGGYCQGKRVEVNYAAKAPHFHERLSNKINGRQPGRPCLAVV